MLKNMTVKQHLDHTIKQWEMVRDDEVDKFHYIEVNDFDNDEIPINDCYLCEVYQRRGKKSTYEHRFKSDDWNCKQCPLAPKEYYCECEKQGPYLKYIWSFTGSLGHFRAANEIVELVKAHKKKINL